MNDNLIRHPFFALLYGFSPAPRSLSLVDQLISLPAELIINLSHTFTILFFFLTCFCFFLYNCPSRLALPCVPRLHCSHAPTHTYTHHTPHTHAHIHTYTHTHARNYCRRPSSALASSIRCRRDQQRALYIVHADSHSYVSRASERQHSSQHTLLAFAVPLTHPTSSASPPFTFSRLFCAALFWVRLVACTTTLPLPVPFSLPCEPCKSLVPRRSGYPSAVYKVQPLPNCC